MLATLSLIITTIAGALATVFLAVVGSIVG